MDNMQKIMELQDGGGKKHPVYGDEFVLAALMDIFERLNQLEAIEAKAKNHAH